jgi:hypothetical protein
MRVSSAHGFDFAGSWPELLQCTEAKKILALPQCIEADLWLLQFRPIECEHVAWRRVGVHTFQVPDQQRLHAIIAKVARFDDGNRGFRISPSAPAATARGFTPPVVALWRPIATSMVDHQIGVNRYVARSRQVVF